MGVTNTTGHIHSDYLTSVVAIADGGSGQTTAQDAINALTQVSGATNEYVLTKDTATGNAAWKVATGGGDLKADGTVPLTANWDVGAFGIRALNLTADGLTSGRIPLVSTDGLLVDSSTLTYNSTTGVFTITKDGGYLNIVSSTNTSNTRLILTNSDADIIDIVNYGRSAATPSTRFGLNRAGLTILELRPNDNAAIGTYTQKPLTLGTNNTARQVIGADGRIAYNGTLAPTDAYHYMAPSNSYNTVVTFKCYTGVNTLYARLNCLNSDDDPMHISSFGRSAAGSENGFNRAGQTCCVGAPNVINVIGTSNDKDSVFVRNATEICRLTSSGISSGLPFISTVSTGTSPLTIASTTVVTNLNADKVDGADLDTSTALGTSDVKVSSQNAVKSYVDARIGVDNQNVTVVRASASTVDVDADFLQVGDFGLASINLTIDITASGANGLDTGSEAASRWYSVFVIYNPTTATTAGLLSYDTAKPSTSNAPTLPSGYTEWRHVGWVYNDSGSNFDNPAICILDKYCVTSTDSYLFTLTDNQTMTAIDLSTTVPPGTKAVSCSIFIRDTTGVGKWIEVYSHNTITIGSLVVYTNVVNLFNSNMGVMALITEQTLYYSSAAKSGTWTGNLRINGCFV